MSEQRRGAFSELSGEFLDKREGKNYICDENGKEDGKTVPIYEYQCINCRRQFEVIQKITDEPLLECKYCAGKLERLISLTNFQLKGTGWYATDYKDTKDRTDSIAEKPPESGDKQSDSTTKAA